MGVLQMKGGGHTPGYLSFSNDEGPAAFFHYGLQSKSGRAKFNCPYSVDLYQISSLKQIFKV